MKPARYITVIGAGSWGTALAITAARHNSVECENRKVFLWTYNKSQAEILSEVRENASYLSGFKFPSNLFVTSNLEEALDQAELVITAVPSQVTRQIYERMKPFLKPQMVFVNASKGIETETLLRMSQVVSEVLHHDFEPRFVSLAGPSFAHEVAKGDPTAVVVASFVPKWSEYVQSELGALNFRIYSNSDVVGVEIGAAVKNVIAIAAGAVTGFGFGHNTLVAVITRGLAEITRLAMSLGGRIETLSGLAGVGDLFLTCTGGLSRNRYVGIELGKGQKLEVILNQMNAVAEGVSTTKAVYELAQRNKVDMPITQAMYQVLYEERPIADSIAEILGRPLKREY